MATKWPTNTYRRKRLQESRDALLQRTKAQQAVLCNFAGTVSSHEVIARLQKLAPCIEAQVQAATDGLACHSSRSLVDDSAHLHGIAAKHLFGRPIASYSDADIKHEQRGMRKQLQPPPPPPLARQAAGTGAPIECAIFEKMLLDKLQTQTVKYIVVEVEPQEYAMAVDSSAVDCYGSRVTESGLTDPILAWGVCQAQHVADPEAQVICDDYDDDWCNFYSIDAQVDGSYHGESVCGDSCGSTAQSQMHWLDSLDVDLVDLLYQADTILFDALPMKVPAHLQHIVDNYLPQDVAAPKRPATFVSDEFQFELEALDVAVAGPEHFSIGEVFELLLD